MRQHSGCARAAIPVIHSITILATAFATGLWALAAETGAARAADADDVDPRFAALEYRSLGPFRGGRSTTVTGVEGDSLTYYFGATGGGVWKTTNAGNSWSNVSDGQFGVGSVGAVAVAPSDANVVYAGTGTADIRGVSAGSGDGVYRSTDAGKTWANVGLRDSRQISDVVIHPTNPDIVYVAAQGSAWAPSEERGIYRSTDGGDTWHRVLFINNVTGASELKMDATNPRILYATMWDHQRTPWEIRSGGEGSGIWKSTDGGNSWAELTEGLPEMTGKIGIAPSPANPDRVWAIVEAKEKGGLYRSDDGGDNWNHINGDRRLYARSWYYMHIDADPVDENTLYISNSGFFRSDDGGKSVTSIRTPHGDHHDLWINPDNPKNIAQANDGGGTVTFDGGQSWSSVNNQPTAQIYRLTVDNAFPYRLYGGQQDNSSVGIRSRGLDGSLGHEDFNSYSGCESAFVAMDPHTPNPRYFYGGCYLGQIGELDIVSGENRDVRVYAELAFGVEPKNRKYRFNWNAPIVVSTHDPSVIYHGGNILFRSSDRGVNWEAVSPDLTRNTPETQGPGGLPITNEVSENYNTLLYVAESPHVAGTIWTGSDDGVLQLTQDGGGSWQDVTPRGVEDGMFNAIDVSPHDPATAWVAYTRFRYNDHTPHIYQTTDNGQRWKDVTEGIPADDFVRVVREDPVRKGLLFAGTEKGVYVSFNSGDNWESLQIELPAVPVTDMQIKGDDLALSTQGRGFWILDDISPLRQMAAGEDSAPLTLYQPKDAFNFLTNGRTVQGNARNPANGAWIYYALGEAPDLEEQTLTLEIVGPDGEVVRTFKSDAEKGEDGGGDAPSAKAGLNRFVWNLRTEGVDKIPGFFAFGPPGPKMGGYAVPTGSYTVRMALGDANAEQPLTVTLDPRITATPDQLAEQQTLQAEIESMVEGVHLSVGGLRSVRDQVKAIMASTRKAGLSGDIKETADALTEAVDEYEDNLTSPKREFFQDVLNWPDKLDANLQFLYGDVSDQIPPITMGMKDRLADLRGEYEAAIAERDRIISEELATFNARYQELGLPAVMMPDPDAESEDDKTDDEEADAE